MLPMTWAFCQLIFANYITQIVSIAFKLRISCDKQNDSHLIFVTASDFNTTIYTAATGGTDQTIKLWRIYALRDCKEAGSSRLVSNGRQV